METPAEAVVKRGPDVWNHRHGGDRMVIPTPRLIESLLYEIPKGKVWTVGELRDVIAETCKADYTCPLTTGIFLRICAEYAETLREEGRKKIPPYWRVVRDNGRLFEKFPGGETRQMDLLRQEGQAFIRVGNAWEIERKLK